jgi:tetratricopeptide (TPR) repeat protein
MPKRRTFRVVAALLASASSFSFCLADEPLTSTDVSQAVTAADNPGKTQQATATDKALALFEQRVKEDPRDFLSYTIIGQLYMRKARETGTPPLYKRAEAAFRRALELKADHTPALIQLAAARSAQHQFAEALQLAQQAYEKAPGHVDALAIIVDASLEIGNYQQAEQTLRRLQHKRPDDPRVLARLAQWAELQGDSAQAVQLVQRAAAQVEADGERGEEAAWYHARLGALFFHTGRLDDAAAHFEAALKKFADYHIALAGLGNVRAAQDRGDEAITLYKQVVTSVPQPSVFAKLGDLYVEAGRQEEAEEQYRQVEDLCTQPGLNQHLYRRELANFYADHDRKLEVALELITQDVKERQDVHGYGILAWVLYKNTQLKQAAEAITMAMKLGTQEAAFFSYAGMIYARIGQQDQARQYLEQALALGPYLVPDEAKQVLRELSASDQPPKSEEH